MSAPDQGPLDALLASHPEECAAVLCAIVMHGRDMVTPDDIASDLCVYGRGPHVSRDLIVRIGVALGREHLVKVSVEGIGQIEAVHRHAIARMGAGVWLAGRCGPTRIAGRYDNREAIAARVATVLGCAPGGVSLGWRSSELEWIGVPGGVLEAESVAALIKAGFEPSVLGWDVPGDCGGTVEQ